MRILLFESPENAIRGGLNILYNTRRVITKNDINGHQRTVV